MKKIKKFTKVLLLAILLSLSMTIEVNAEESAMTITGTITARLDDLTRQDQLQVYKIIDYYYYSETNELKHSFTKDFADFLQSTEEYASFTIEEYYQLTSGSGVDYIETPASELENLTSKYLIYLKKNNIFGTGLDMTTYFNATITVPVGAYLIYPTSTTSVYAPMVANVDYVESNGNWVVKNAELSVKNEGVSGTITVGDPDYISYTATKGKEFSYYIRATAPTYPANAINKKYSIINKLSEGIEIAGLSKIKIYCNDQEYESSEEGIVKDEYGNTIATITFIDQILTIDFNIDYVYYSNIYIEYKAKLNENAKIGEEGNQNSMYIIYALDPYGTDTYRHGGYGVNVYTYDLAILKYDKDDKTKLLDGAVFEIYQDEDLTDLVGTITTGTEENGVGLFHGLAQQKFYIKEKKAPSGYKLIKDVIVYELDADQYVGMPMSLADGDLPEGTFLLEIPNEKISFLPVTGGIGTIIYTLTGLLIVIGAFYYIKIYKKKQTNM